MRHVISFLKKVPFVVVLFVGFLLPVRSPAQTDAAPFDRFEQLKRRMDEQMLRILPPADSTFSKGGRLQISPDSNSFFYFHVDTTLDGSSSHFFNFRSFGFPEGAGPSGLDQIFERFLQGMDPFDRLNNGGDISPRDDGHAPPSDEDLLPEERLRQREGQTPAPDSTPKPKESSKVKTIRI